jgi:hypothetical protein
MAFCRSFLYIAAVLIVFSTVAHAQAQKPALMTALPGTWNCTYQGPKGTRTSTITVTSANDNWLQTTSKTSAYGTTPAHEGLGLLGYDSKKSEYVSMGGNTLAGNDDWGLGTAKASPTATTVTFDGGYPPDPSHEKDTWAINGSSMTYTSTWTEKGKAMSGHGSCTKQ